MRAAWILLGLIVGAFAGTLTGLIVGVLTPNSILTPGVAPFWGLLIGAGVGAVVARRLAAG